ncbi:MAG: ATP synthase F1 subunit delta [Firmicutes bacterium]|nr:ATP synthase F1 subunit delta [Bacillota bacterium]
MTALDPGTLARALLSIARERLDPQTVADELAQVTRILASVPLLKRTLADAGIPAEERRSVVSDALGNFLSPVTLGLLDLLIDENQVHTVGAVADVYRRLLDEDRGVVRARVTSAVELSQVDVEALRAGLAEKLGGHVVIEQQVDPGILGGLIVQVGDTVFDGSIAGRLRRLREELETPPPANGEPSPAPGTGTAPATGTPPAPTGPSAAPPGE